MMMTIPYTDNRQNRHPNSVNARRVPVNSRHCTITRQLLPHIASAARAEPAKVLSLKTGISARQITDLREERRLPQVPTFLVLAQHDPALKAQVLAILSGDALACSPQSIDDIVRLVTGRQTTENVQRLISFFQQVDKGGG